VIAWKAVKAVAVLSLDSDLHAGTGITLRNLT
jgi:hypothetical protein